MGAAGMTDEKLNELRDHIKSQLKIKDGAILKMRTFDASLNLDVANQLIDKLDDLTRTAECAEDMRDKVEAQLKNAKELIEAIVNSGIVAASPMAYYSKELSNAREWLNTINL